MLYAKLPADFPKPTLPPKRWFEDERWLMQQSRELAQRYPEQWIAIFNKEVIAAGTNAAEVLRLAQEKTGERDIVVDMVSPTRKFYSDQSRIP